MTNYPSDYEITTGLRRMLKCFTMGEHISTQVVHLECGLCEKEYEVFLLNGNKVLTECPECGNNTLQMLVGTD